MSFDRVAPHYCWLEMLVFGRQLQEARVAFVREVGTPRRVLVVGEGNGRFLSEFVSLHPGAEIDCVEASARMIELAGQRVSNAKVHFIQEDIRQVELRPKHYDLLVTHFFLDCFPDRTLAEVVAELAGAASPRARWLIADFREPSAGWRRRWARTLIGIMYLFFRAVAGIQARQLADYRPVLQSHGFQLLRETRSPNDMIQSELWQRG